MPVSDLLRIGVSRLTSQQIADFMLQADRLRRRYIREGRFVEARAQQIEIDRLARQLP